MKKKIRHRISKTTGHCVDLTLFKIRRLGSGKAMTKHPVALPLRYATIHNTGNSVRSSHKHLKEREGIRKIIDFCNLEEYMYRSG